ncbi:MAG: GNAT family N-acetyltransferase [Coxiellaceae bacterium]|nr:MAG: GNAT family N-acetyltransferase [Coxiellaceae bacterium]
MLNFRWLNFTDLSVPELYAILALRSDVFVVEQSCVYLDPDGKDSYAIHLLGEEAGELVAYLRLFPPTDIENYLVFGRVVTSRAARTKGYGKKMMQELLVYCNKYYPGVEIKCSAQFYLKKFYESFGFQALGEVYDEDGIPHISMRKAW